MRKKILFIRPRKETDNYAVPHLGLGLLSSLLKERGHETLVLDYLLFLDKTPPSLEGILDNFNPDVVGITVCTSTFDVSLKILERVRSIVDIPVLIGGPHATLYADELAELGVGDYIVRGEGETVITELVESGTRQRKPLIIEAPRPDMDNIPLPDFSSFLNYEEIKVYPLQTSRGCPYQCRFCAVRHIATRKWRKRDIHVCFEEIKKARRYLPNLKTVKIVDDAPTTDRARFKGFLRDYISEGICLEMVIDNMRADSVDEELAILAKKAGNDALCIAVEHADAEVFRYVNKGESLEQIEKAARFIKKARLKLGLCFIIGLPYDSYEKTIKSARFARRLNADFIYWNMAHPMRGTELRAWFEANGGILYPDENYTSFDYHTLKSPHPVVETPDFPLREREKAYFVASVMTDQYPLRTREIYYLFSLGRRYNLLGLALFSLARRLFFFPGRIAYYLSKKVRKLRRRL